MTIRSTPWRPRRLEPQERSAKASIGDRFPARSNGLYLGALSSLLGCGDLTLHLSAIGNAPALVPAEEVLIAICNPVGSPTWRAVLTLPGPLARLILDTGLGRRSGWAGLPLTSGEQGALLYLLDRAVKDWIGAGGGRFYISGLLADADQIPAYLEAPVSWQISADLRGEQLHSVLNLYVADPGPPCPKALPIAGIAHQARRWQVRIGISVGVSKIPLEDVQNLAPGDLVLLDRGGHPRVETTESQVALGSGKWTRTGTWVDPRRIRLAADNEKGTPMETKAADTPDIRTALEPSRDNDAAQMEVTVRVEVGELKMSVDQATALVPGRVLELDREVGSEVALKVGDKLIARGEMVDHEGRLAVEVTEVK